MNHKNYAPRVGTVRELKRQAAFNRTSYDRYEAKHQAKQAALAEKIAKLEEQIAAATELEEMEAK